ncbi:MAG: autotransporter domain-containing protein [Planctomycetaceae bacterium]|nr:autotransporter domain-containing protein [Planctomycetaceae bacterium]
MKTFQVKYQCVKAVAVFLAVMFLPVMSANAGEYEVQNTPELLTVLANIENNVTGYTDNENTIILTDNVTVPNPSTFEIKANKKLTIKLNHYNLTGAGILNLVGHQIGADSETRSVFTIIGSTTDFVDGIHINGQAVVNYVGIYTSRSTDRFGENVDDDVTVNLIKPGSAWDAYNHDIIVGDLGTADFNIYSSGGWVQDSKGNWVKDKNWGRSENITIGNGVTGDGTFNMWGAGTTWDNQENTVAGKAGTGEFNLWAGAVFKTGNFAVGTDAGGTGTANIHDAGTILDIYGTNVGTAPGTAGDGNMYVYDRAEVYLHYNDTLTGDAYLTLGTGETKFGNDASGSLDRFENSAYLQIDRGFINGSTNVMTFENGSYLEGTQYEGTETSPGSGIYTYAQHGSIALRSLNFGQDAVLSAGFGNKTLYDRNLPLDFSIPGQIEMYYLGKNAGDARFGSLYLTGDLNLNAGSTAIFDFDVQGNSNHANAKQEHKDYMEVTGTATLNGHLHFRPMTGYYTNDIDIQFMSSSTGTPDLTLWPNRWFENPAVNNGHLTMTRDTSPFTDAAGSSNEYAVAEVLDTIYNKRQGINEGEDMDVQKRDDWFPVLDWFWPMDDDSFRAAMRQLSGETRAASFFMPIRSPWRFGFDRVNWRKRDNHVYFGPQNIHSPHVAKNDIWVNPYYDTMHMQYDGNTTRATTSRVSFMAGYDRALSSNTAVGLLFSYSQPRLDQGFSRVIADDYLFGLHAGTRLCDDYELKFWAGYGTQSYDMRRDIPIENGKQLTAHYGGSTWTGSAQIARPFGWKNGVLRPLLALDYSYVNQGSTEEEGFYPVALVYEKSDWSQLFGRAGMRADFGWQRFNFTASAAYSYQFAGDVTPVSTNRFLVDDPAFDIQGSDLSRSFVSVGLGTQLYLNHRRSRMLFLQYNGDYGKRSNEQTASLGYQMTY